MILRALTPCSERPDIMTNEPDSLLTTEHIVEHLTKTGGDAISGDANWLASWENESILVTPIDGPFEDCETYTLTEFELRHRDFAWQLVPLTGS
ncbi:MAG: hypothetical protein ACI9R3_004931 [Verrucomicrobiales bacterium]